MTNMLEITEELIDPEKIKSKEWVTQKIESTVRQVRPTANDWEKELWSGSDNGMYYIGDFILEKDVKAYYSYARIAPSVMMPPVAMQQWGNFLTEYVNSVSVSSLPDIKR